jgi:hypothetical protein
VNRLEHCTAQARRAIYAQARAAVAAQLRSLVPPVGESELKCERLALERVIGKVEMESRRHSPPLPQTSIRQSESPSDDLVFVRRLVPDLSAELEILQKKIRRRDGRGSLLPARNVVPITLMGFLILTFAVSGAH